MYRRYDCREESWLKLFPVRRLCGDIARRESYAVVSFGVCRRRVDDCQPVYFAGAAVCFFAVGPAVSAERVAAAGGDGGDVCGGGWNRDVCGGLGRARESDREMDRGRCVCGARRSRCCFRIWLNHLSQAVCAVGRARSGAKFFVAGTGAEELGDRFCWEFLPGCCGRRARGRYSG